MRVLSLIIGLCVLTMSCQKKQDEPIEPNHIGPTIRIHEPQKEQAFSIGDTLSINLNLSSDVGLHEFRIRMICDNEELVEIGGHSHAFERQLEYQWVNNAPMGDMWLVIDATDHNFNTSTKSMRLLSQE